MKENRKEDSFVSLLTREDLTVRSSLTREDLTVVPATTI